MSADADVVETAHRLIDLRNEASRILAAIEKSVASAPDLLLPEQRKALDEAVALAADDPRARAVESIEEAVRGADIVALCTSSPSPVIEASWIGRGTHVTSVGYRPPAGELPPALATSAHLFVETRHAFEPPPVGCGELAGLDPAAGTELGEVVLGRRSGRRDATEITAYKAMGNAVEDLAAAALVYQRALADGAGLTIEL